MTSTLCVCLQQSCHGNPFLIDHAGLLFSPSSCSTKLIIKLSLKISLLKNWLYKGRVRSNDMMSTHSNDYKYVYLFQSKFKVKHCCSLFLAIIPAKPSIYPVMLCGLLCLDLSALCFDLHFNIYSISH